MRPTLPLLLVALALLTAGCASPDENGGGATPTPPSDGGDTNAGGSDNSTPDDGANETADDGAENETEEPAPAPEPAEVASVTYGYPTSASTEAEPHLEAFDVAEGYTTLAMNVTFSPSSSAGLLGAGYASGIRVQLLDPAGAPVGDVCTLEGPVTETSTCAATAEVTAAGAWSISFEGSGAVSAAVVVNAS